MAYHYDFSTLDWDNYAYKFIFTLNKTTERVLETPWVGSFNLLSSDAVKTSSVYNSAGELLVILQTDRFSVHTEFGIIDVGTIQMEMIKIRKSPYIT